MEILSEDQFPKTAVVRYHSGYLKFIRYVDGTLNVWGCDKDGALIGRGGDYAIDMFEAAKLENLFDGIAPRSFGASQLRLFRLIHDGLDDCVLDQHGNKVEGSGQKVVEQAQQPPIITVTVTFEVGTPVFGCNFEYSVDGEIRVSTSTLDKLDEVMQCLVDDANRS